jgi:hypothetical protein
MPTILTLGGLAVRVYPNDHRPAHVHVIGNGCEAVFNLPGPATALELRENFGFRPREVSRIRAQLGDHLEALLAAWETIHGPA